MPRVFVSVGRLSKKFPARAVARSNLAPPWWRRPESAVRCSRTVYRCDIAATEPALSAPRNIATADRQIAAFTLLRDSRH
jgi:hypothetical protein